MPKPKTVTFPMNEKAVVKATIALIALGPNGYSETLTLANKLALQPAALSYGVKCAECGEYETQCTC